MMSIRGLLVKGIADIISGNLKEDTLHKKISRIRHISIIS